MQIAILGFGKEGKSVLRFLKKSSRYKGAKIAILDQNRDKDYLKYLGDYDLVIKSPGVPYSLPEIVRARASGVLFTSATALFFDHAQGLIIGITGTKGKGTTAMLLYRMLKSCKKNVHLAGNIGIPMLDMLPKLNKNSIVVLELSSFQLDHLLFSPRIAVVLDIFPDHLDVHTSFNEYVEAKAQIVANQGRADVVFYFPASKLASSIAKQSHGKKIAIKPEHFKLFYKEDVHMPGVHNFQNAVMASSVALYLGCEPLKVRKAALSFSGLPFRLERVRILQDMPFYNDSASTNPPAAAAAIRAFDAPTILIAGGRDKGFSYDTLRDAASWPALRHIILVGENISKLKEVFSGKDVTTAHSLEKAVNMAWRYALKKRKKGEKWNIVYSPGAASFDMFKNYTERGKAFNRIVKKLKV